MLSDQLIITIAGKKGSGKNTLGNFCVGYFLKHTEQIGDFRIEKNGTLSLKPNECKLFQNIKNGEFNPEYFEGKSVKLYSFADPLKQFCINTLGLTFEQCYGTDTEKNELTHCRSSSSSSYLHEITNCASPTYHETEEGIRLGYCYALIKDPRKLTAREVMQIFGTEMVRSLWQDAWVFATYEKIQDEGYDLAIITDARFVNEIEMGVEYGAKTIRLERSISTTDLHASETALDDYPDNKFNTVIHNANMTIREQNEVTAALMERWLGE